MQSSAQDVLSKGGTGAGRFDNHAELRLARQSLEAHGRLFLRVSGSSMTPSLLPGDLLTLRPCKAREIEVGALAAFGLSDRLVVHRVVARDETRLTTRGDATLSADPPLAYDDVLGVVDRILRNGRTLTPSRAPSLAARALAVLASRSTVANKALQRAYIFAMRSVTPLGKRS